jgi:predicted nucleic acid-binding protein
VDRAIAEDAEQSARELQHNRATEVIQIQHVNDTCTSERRKATAASAALTAVLHDNVVCEVAVQAETSNIEALRRRKFELEQV